ncbi:hypothetical protein KQI61_05930 [Anaerocolumna aminovalerica]|uniref:hypothetical protein n=1 Tax=Anaerocolumna aminovalerica TaxID=1527 RepID=UPI001C0EE153|nr:hypothetical protein [Anaerocolumna aminovalerica]MBU5331729.1 hypothetical protein [Anaerocolumna aminovalerica]
MKNTNNKELITYLVTLGLMLLLVSLWQFLEWVLYGEIQHRIVDDIISIPIMCSLYFNAKYWLDDKNI